MATGIIATTKVVRCALQNAASITGLMIITEAMIANVPEPAADHTTSPGAMI